MSDATTSVETTTVASQTTSFIRNTARTMSESGVQKIAAASSAFQNFGSEIGAPYNVGYALNFGRVFAIDSSAQSMSSTEAAYEKRR